MICSISGETPREPVVSTKSGYVYEKDLIIKYINEHGTEPSTNETLSSDDLLPLRDSSVVRPRPPTLTSVPALLATLQNEWDAFALESYSLREQLLKTREELAHALYQNDAAVRVIARLTKERDEARSALSNITVAPGASTSNSQSSGPSNGLPQDIVDSINEVHESLSKTRKRRPVPANWASPEDVSSFSETGSIAVPVPQISTLSVHGDNAVVAGPTGSSSLVNLTSRSVINTNDVGESVTQSLAFGSYIVHATTQGNIKVYEDDVVIASFAKHAGAVTGIAIHPNERLLVSVGIDKNLVYYDLKLMQPLSQIQLQSALSTCAFHPDGHLVVAGTEDGEIICLFSHNLEVAATFKLDAPVSHVAFSENGFWFAAFGKGQSIATLFDIRKGDEAKFKVIETSSTVHGLAWDYTGQFLAITGSGGTMVQQYTKSTKSWSEPLQTSTVGSRLQWGPNAKSLLVASEGSLSILGLPA